MGTTPNSNNSPASPDCRKERRSERSKALIPVFVYGHGSSEEPFHEEAYAAVVSDNGGLLIMNARVQPGQSLLITNRATQEEIACRVAYVGAKEPDQPTVAVEFVEPTSGFWRLTKRLAMKPGNAKTGNPTVKDA